MQELIKIQEPAAMESGIFPSLAPNQLALWREAENILFVDGGAEKSTGVQELHSVGGTIVALAQAYVEGDQRAYFGKADTLYKWEESTGELILRTGFAGERWSLVPWGTWLLAVNGVDKPQIWKNGAALSMVDWPNVPVAAQAAKIVRKLANRPILFAGQEMFWPRATDIEYWTVPDPTGNAGSLPFRDLDSDVMAVEPFGEQLALYTENKMGFVSFIGGTSVYGFKVRLEGIGALSINAVIPVGAFHYGMSRDGIWRTDGSSFSYIDQPAVNRYLDGLIDPDEVESVVGVHAKDKSMVQWFFTDLNGTRRGLGFNYKAGSWHALKMPVTAAAPQEAFYKPLVALGPNFGLYDTGTDLGPAVMSSRLLSSPFNADTAERYKWWDMVEVNVRKVGNVEVRFGLHKHEVFGDDPNDEWTAWMPLEKINWVQREAVYLTMEIRSLSSSTAYRIGGLSVHGEPAGWVQ